MILGPNFSYHAFSLTIQSTYEVRQLLGQPKEPSLGYQRILKILLGGGGQVQQGLDTSLMLTVVALAGVC